MMRLSIVLASLVVVAACAKTDTASDTAAATPSTTTSSEDRATKAATVSKAIAANPAAADSILTANGYTRESFEAAMYEIAGDSAEAAKYAAAKAR